MYWYIVSSTIAIAAFTIGIIGYTIYLNRKSKTASARAHTFPLSHPDRDQPNGVEAWLLSQIEHYSRLIKEEEDDHRDETPDVAEGLYYAIVAYAVLLLAYAALLIHWAIPAEVTVFGTPFNPQIIAYLPLITYVIVSFHQVEADKVAGADFFGTPVMQFGHGLKWVPFGLLKFRKEYGTLVQSEFPGDADHIQWDDEKTPLREGKVRPIYALTGEDPKGDLPTDKQMNLGLSALAKFQIVPERFFDFVMNIGPIDREKRAAVLTTMTGGQNVSDNILEVVRHLRDTSTGILREILGQMSYNEITKHLHLINVLYFLRVKRTVIKSGIKMVEVSITNTNPGHEFNSEIQIRSRAINQRDNLITVAEGERVQLVKRGEGAAAAELALLNARAKGYKKIAETAKTAAGKVAISADVAGKLAESENNTVVVGTDGLKELIGIVATAKKVK